MGNTVERINLQSSSPWEPLRGYSRAVKVGNTLYISGTTAVKKDGEIAGIGNPYDQTRFVIETLKSVLVAFGFQLSDVVRTRLYVTDMKQWNDYARAHREAFDSIRPASSIVEVTRLTDPRMLIEMEAEAIQGCQISETRSL